VLVAARGFAAHTGGELVFRQHFFLAAGLRILFSFTAALQRVHRPPNRLDFCCFPGRFLFSY
jgi:hypothetical protein